MIICYRYRPDHNGECLNCDEWLDMHPQPVDPVLQRELRYWRQVFMQMPQPQLSERLALELCGILLMAMESARRH